MKKFCFTTLNTVRVGLLVCAAITIAATFTLAGQDQAYPPTTVEKLSKAYLTVTNMSCGGCVDTINRSLADIPGIAEVSVNVARGTAEVMFDPKTLEDRQKIARAISAAGYPAEITRIASASEVQQQSDLAAERAKSYIASVGRTEISRQDYDSELGHVRKRYEQIYGKDVFTSKQGKPLLQRIKSQIAQGLIDEGIKLQEMDRAGYKVPKDALDQAFQQYLIDRKTTFEQLKTDLAANDYPYDYFRRKFENKIRLQHYLENEVFGNSVDDDARQQKYSHWLANARALAKVTYHDKQLEGLVAAGRGSSCSGGGTGGCSKAR